VIFILVLGVWESFLPVIGTSTMLKIDVNQQWRFNGSYPKYCGNKVAEFAQHIT
jgi:hypothetical protein